MENILTFGTKLALERKKAKLTQEQLGKIGGVGQKTQGKYERDVNKPDVGYLEAISDVVDVNYLITGYGRLDYYQDQANEIAKARKGKPKANPLALVKAGFEIEHEYEKLIKQFQEQEEELKKYREQAKVNQVLTQAADTPINMEILQFAIETIETALDKTRATMNPDKKANVVRVAYELFMEAEEKGEEERAKTKSNVIHLMTAMGGN